MSAAMPFLVLFLYLPSLTYSQSCPQAPFVNVPGNLVLGGFFNIHEPGPLGQECGSTINPDAIQRMEAFLFTIDNLNALDFVPGVTFGALVYDTCGRSEVAGKRALNYLARREASQAGQNNQCNYWPAFVGSVGPYYSEEALKVASLFSSAHVTQIIYSARVSDLSDKETYPYLLRTIPEGKIIARVLIDILRELGWYDVAVVAGDDPDAADLLSELHRLAGGEDICLTPVIKIDMAGSFYDKTVAELVEVHNTGVRGVILLTLPGITENLFRTLDFYSSRYEKIADLQWLLAHPFRDSWKYQSPNVSQFIRGLIAVEEYSGDMAEFRNYFLSLDPFSYQRNPWFPDYWEQVNNCTLYQTCTTGSKTDHAQHYKQGIEVSQVIAAVEAYGYAMKSAHYNLCKAGTSGTCNALGAVTAQELVSYMKQTEFVTKDQEFISFDANGDLETAKYAIMNVQMDGTSYLMKQVGKWTSTNGLDLTGQSPITFYDREGIPLNIVPPSQCNVVCSCANSKFDNSYGMDLPGDIMIPGIFDIHSSGAFGKECDFTDIDSNAIQALEAFYFAIDQINLDSAILPGIKLTGVALDSCRNPARAARQVKEILNKEMIIADQNRKPMSPKVVIGGASSDVTMALAELLTSHKIPQVSYGATNAELSDRKKYPYFLRTVGSDSAQARAIVDILIQYNWRTVAAVYSNNVYGKAAFREFMTVAEEEKICVSTQVPLEDYFARDREAMNNVAKYYLIRGLQNASVVVLLTTDTDARELLAAMKRTLAGRTNSIVWVASDYWGSRAQVVKDIEDVAEGAITLGFYAEEVKPFMTYFRNIHPQDTRRNPWFAEYWQRHFECHIDNALRQEYPNPCQQAPGQRLSLQTQDIKMADQVPYVIDAVYAAVVALHNMIIDYCQEITFPICSEAQHNMVSLYDYMEISDFHNSITGLNVTFDVLGNGIPRYNVYNFRRDKTFKLKYTLVGTWVKEILQLRVKDLYAFLDSSGDPIPSTQVSSQCVDCLCTKMTIADLKFQLQYEQLTLMGFFPIHQQSESGSLCAQYRSDMGFLDFMAFKYAIDQVNNSTALLPELRLGYMAFDTCSDTKQAQTVFAASRDQLRLFSQRPQVPRLTYVQAFIGGYESDTTSDLNKMNYRGRRWVQVTPGSRTMDVKKYPFLLRTAAAEDTEARCLVAAVKALGWTYLSLVVSDSKRARMMEPLLRSALEDSGVCIAVSLSINETPSGPDQYKDVIDTLLQTKGAIGVVLLADPQGIGHLLQVATHKDVVGRLVWLGFDKWAHEREKINPYLDVLKGALLVAPDVTSNPKFDAFMQKQNLLSDPNNPWFREFWQTHFQCNVDYNGGYTRPCTGKESLKDAVFSDRQSVISTINAVYSYAQGLTNMFDQLCGAFTLPPCPSMMGLDAADMTLEFIKDARVQTGADGMYFSYSPEGSGPGRFRIFNVQIKEGATSFVQIGRWDAGRLQLNRSSVRMYNSDGKLAFPVSVCPGTCNCSQRQPLLDKENVPVEMAAHREVWGVIVLTIALLGIIFAIVIMMFFLFNFKHPVVEAATCSLSVMLLIGIILLYLLIFPFMISSTYATCGIRRLGLATFYAVVFACLLIKVVRINRMTNRASLGGRVPFIGGPSQCCLAFLLIFIQLIISIEWLILEPADVRWYLTNIKEEGEYPIYAINWRCAYTQNALVTSLVYVFLLVLLTLIISLKSVNSLETHREAVYIAMTSFLTIIILVCWICAYMLAGPMYQNPAICVGITINASVVLVFVFVPKMALMTTPKANPSRGPSTNSVDGEVAYSVPNRRGPERPQQDADIGNYLEETPPVPHRRHNSGSDLYSHVLSEHVTPGKIYNAHPVPGRKTSREESRNHTNVDNTQHIHHDVVSTAL